MNPQWITPRRLGYAIALTLLLLVFFPVIALADNCGSVTDCWMTAAGGAAAGAGLAGVAGGLGLAGGLAPPPGAAPPPDPQQEQADRLAREFAEREARDAQRARTAESLRQLIKSANPTHSRINCGKMVDAVDKSLGDGQPPSAPDGMKGDMASMAKEYGSHWQPGFGPQDAAEQLRDAGPGSRGIIRVVDGSGSLAHVVNVVNIGGDIYYVDGQSGRAGTDWGAVEPGYGDDADAKHQFLQTHPPT